MYGCFWTIEHLNDYSSFAKSLLSELKFIRSSEEMTSNAAESSHVHDVEEKIVAARRYKDEGNVSFKEGKYSKARSKYATALAYTKGLPGRPMTGNGGDPMTKLAADQSHAPPLSIEQVAELNELDAILKTNISTCYIKLQDGNAALQFASEALEIKADYWKALFRKAEAYQLLKNHDKAIASFDQALSLVPDESSRANIQKARIKSAQMIKIEKEKQKKAFAGIFEKDREESTEK